MARVQRRQAKGKAAVRASQKGFRPGWLLWAGAFSMMAAIVAWSVVLTGNPGDEAEVDRLAPDATLVTEDGPIQIASLGRPTILYFSFEG